MFDCHLHSNFSGDSELPVENACSKAIELGLNGIIFTDHLDFDYPGYEDTYFNINFQEYLPKIHDLSLRYNSRLEVLCGIEVGIQPHVLNETISVVKSYDFDYVIGSVHIIDRLDPYTDGEFFNGRTKQTAYERYLKEIIHMLEIYDNFDVLGHYDYITRYGPYDDRTMKYEDYADLFDEIFRELIKKGKGIEINTGSYRDKNGKATPLFDINVIKRYSELGGEIICLGSDAHFAEHVGYKFNHFSSLLKEAGFNYLAYYKERKPVFYKIP